MVEEGKSFNVADAAASFQSSVVDVLVTKAIAAAEEHGVRQIILAGGVAANKHLRETLVARSTIPVSIPPIILCTDNAAMIAVVGWHLLTRGLKDSLDLNAVSRWPLDSLLKHNS
jgi:N6-L-threonylcarbamoyladenine synthase